MYFTQIYDFSFEPTLLQNVKQVSDMIRYQFIGRVRPLFFGVDDNRIENTPFCLSKSAKILHPPRAPSLADLFFWRYL
jgi:hypothetical protein